MRRGCAIVVAVLMVSAWARAADAQELSRVSVDSIGAVDLFGGEGTTGNPNASLDISSVVRLGGGWSLQIRPWFFKSSAEGSTWSRELYQGSLRYERPGTTAVRLETGFIPSPIGLGMLDMRADINPTIQGHPSYFMPLPRFDRLAPSVRGIAGTYPFGANLTVSQLRWDVRAALVNSAPTRRYAFNSTSVNPDRTPVTIVGGGVTLIPGLRIGTSLATGRYATATELPSNASGDRTFRLWTAEGEYAFGYTKLAAEFTRTRFTYEGSASASSTWFVQGMQTLSPRWFVAGRQEVVDAPPAATAPASTRPSFRSTEATAGYRLTPELTLRSSVVLVRGYSATTRDRRVGLQIVWSRRWW